MDKNLNINATFTDNATQGLSQLGGLLDDFGKGLAVGAIVAGLGLIADKFVEATNAALDFADKLNDLSERWGVGTDKLSELAYAAQLSGTDLDGVTTSMRKLSKSMEEARDPSSDMASLFDQMGISVTDTEGKMKTADVMFAEIADKFKDMPNGMEKARLAMEIFGKSGADLIPMLNKGKVGLAEMSAEAKEFGVIWSPEQSAAAADFKDDVDRVKLAVQGMFTQIAQALIPTLSALAKGFVESAKEGGLLRAVFDIIVTSVKAVDFVMKPLILGTYILTSSFSTLGRMIGGVAAALVEFLSGNFTGSKNIISSMQDDLSKTGQQLLDFHAKLYNTGPAAAAAVTANDTVVPSVKRVGDAAKEVTKDIEKYLATLRKQRDEVGASEEMKKQVELEAKLLELKQKGATTKQIEDTRNKAQIIIEETNARQDNWDVMQKQLESEIRLNEARKSNVSDTEDLRFENSLINLTNDARRIAIELRKLEKSMVGATAAEIAKLTDERKKELEIQTEQNKLEGLLSDTIDVRTEKARENVLVLTRALEAGKVTEAQYIEAVQIEMEKLSGKAKLVADEMTEFFKEAARNIQNAMSDFLFDFMQGKMSDFGETMKKMIDRMVANFLAAKAATALFGADFGASGNVGGLIGGVISGIAGARAEGGPVYAGKTYLVGEKRAELFTPSSNGYISPDTSALQANSNNVAINISALDGADVMRVLGARKKEIANMVTSTNRTYNLRGT